MTIEKKTKTGLDETRLLMLGGTILLGFQFNGVFQERFEGLSSHAKALNAVALLLMVASIALMTAPSVRHRIVEQGRVSNEMLGVISRMAGWALMPFALSLGLDIFIVVEAMFGTASALAAGLTFTGLALWFWFGLEFWRRGSKEKPMPSETHRLEPPLPARIDQMLTEARVILPGAQALLGFQLIIVMSKSFGEVPELSKLIHALALGCMALAIVLLMAPAAYHRIVHGGDDTEDMLRTGSRLVTFATVPLALGIVADVYVTIEHIRRSPALAIGAAALALVVLVGLWHAYPLYARYRRTNPTSARRKYAR